MKQELAVITGATSGIGKSLTQTLASQGIIVFGIGRDEEKLKQLVESTCGDNIIPCQCDITKNDDIDSISTKIKTLSKTNNLKYLIHNATVLAPIKPLTEVQNDELAYQIAVNVNGPMLLTNTLLPYFADNARILFASTGASRVAVSRLVPHCAAKAAQVILAKGYKDELANRKILVGIIEPSVVNTPAQEYVRSLSEEELPFSTIARRIYHEGSSLSSEDCATLIANLLKKVEDETFTNIWPWKFDDEVHLEKLRS